MDLLWYFLVYIILQELKFDAENGVHYLDILPLKVDVGKYTLVFEVILKLM